MKILFLTDNFPPEVNAPATRTYEHCREWIKQGAEITVITCAPNFPHGKVYPGYKNRLWSWENMDGIRVLRVWSYISANEGFLKRTLDYASFGKTAFIASLFIKCDVIVATSPQFFVVIAGYLASIFKRKPWVFELRDLWPDSIRAVGALKNEKILKFLEKIELFLYRKADKIVALTDAFKANLASRGIDADKIAVVPNGSNLELFAPRKKDKDLMEKLGLQKKFVVGYIGTHGMAHGLDFIVRAIAKVTDKNIRFLFVGDGAEKKKIVKFAAELNLENATFLDSVPKEEVPRYMGITDAVLVNLKREDTFKTVLPSKIFEGAAMKKPILLGVNGEARKIVEEYDAGLFFYPEDENDFREKLNRLVSDENLYEKLSSGCENLARSYDRKILAEKMLEYLGKLTPNH